MSDNITLPRAVAEKALSMLDLLGLLGENVAGRVRAALAESTVKDSLTVEETLHRENDRLREALRHISLCSQNSMSSKEECGRIARAALWQRREDTK